VVVLPASMCAMIPMLRVLARPATTSVATRASFLLLYGWCGIRAVLQSG
jgi:hypothetical protein